MKLAADHGLPPEPLVAFARDLIEIPTVNAPGAAYGDGSVAGLLLEGVVLRVQSDLCWLEACARYWNATKGRS